VTDTEILEALNARDVLPWGLAERVTQVPRTTAWTLLGRLVAAGGDEARMVRAYAEAVGLPVAGRVLISSASPVSLPPALARVLLDIGACPVKRDERGTVHFIVCDVAARDALARIVPQFEATVASERQVKELLADLYAIGAKAAVPLDPIDVDMEATGRLPPSPGGPTAPMAPAPAPAAPAPRPPVAQPPVASLPQDPLAPRASGPFSQGGARRFTTDDETLRVPRAPRVGGDPLQEKTIEDTSAPHALLDATHDAARRAFVRGVLVGALPTALVALVIIAALLMR
jgi:hypothetical protein